MPVITKTPTAGRQSLAQILFKQNDPDRGASLQLGLMTNAGVDDTLTLAGIIEPTGGGYSRLNLVDANWTVNSTGISSQTQQVFTATGTAYSAPITGHFICGTGTSPKLYFVQLEDPANHITVNVNESYRVSPQISLLGP